MSENPSVNPVEDENYFLRGHQETVNLSIHPSSNIQTTNQDELLNSPSIRVPSTIPPKPVDPSSTSEQDVLLKPSQSQTVLPSLENDNNPNSNNAQPNSSVLIRDLRKAAPKEKRGKCRRFALQGSCPFKERCRYEHVLFDHGQEELVIGQDGAEKNEGEGTKGATPRLRVLQPTLKSIKNKPCWYFYRRGNCNHGDGCLFSHQMRKTVSFQEKPFEADQSIKEKEEELCENIVNEEKMQKTDLKRPKQRCRYFSRFKFCQYGEECRFLHQVPNLKNEEQRSPVRNKINPAKNPENYKGEIKKLEDLLEEDIKTFRQKEIMLVKKQFAQSLKIVSSDESEEIFHVNFSSTDPDWQFAVKNITLTVKFLSTYPKEPLLIFCEDEKLPPILMRHLNKAMSEWLEKRNQHNAEEGNVELVFRPFIRWLDQNLEQIFYDGLKKVKLHADAQNSGIEFVPYEELSKNVTAKSESDKADSPCIASNESPIIEEEFKPKCTEVKIVSIDPQNIIPTTIQRKGTEIKFRNLELTEQAATLSCQKLALTIQCGRCRMRSDILTPPHRTNRVVCSKCNHTQIVTFRPQLLHQFLAVLGYLDLKDCLVSDVPLSKCDFALGCLNCNRQMVINGMQYGQRNNFWCLYCNVKMKVYVESVKFLKLQSSAVDEENAQLLSLGKKIKKVNDPLVQEGKPLPYDGTCKHYKKSFRWLRFPCCGKAYPCDECHDEKEDHEMKRATRMICGFCAKEQTYTNGKECVGCRSCMTKKAGSHWEGGKGCRDKVKMSREDNHKFVGVNKTVSRKVQLKEQ